MTATAKAVGNGSTTTEKHVPAQREHGLNRLREEECYHLTTLIRECLDEAGHLVRKVHGKAYNRTLDYDGSKGTAPLDRAEAQRILTEACGCAAVAIEYMYRAFEALADEDGEAPF